MTAMDPQGSCVFFGLNPFFTAEIDISKDLVDDADKRSKVVTAAKADSCQEIYNPDGRVTNKLLLVFDPNVVSKTFTKEGKYEFTFNNNSYTATMINSYAVSQSSKIEPKKSFSKDYMRKIRYFSGRDRVTAGESDIIEWITCAQDVIEGTENVVAKDKIDYLKNSLTGDALILYMSSREEITTPQQLVDLISRTYGGDESLDHLEYDFKQMVQKDKEKPSRFWTRLQSTIVRIKKISTYDEQAVNLMRIRQFKLGLCPTDNDVIRATIDLHAMSDPQSIPSYGRMLQWLQDIERERLERFRRAGDLKVRSALVNVQDDDLDSLRAQVSKLTVDCAQASACKLQEPAAVTVAQLSTHAPGYKGRRQGKFDKRQKKTVYCWVCGSTEHKMLQCKAKFDPEKFQGYFDAYRSSRAERAVKPKELP